MSDYNQSRAFQRVVGTTLGYVQARTAGSANKLWQWVTAVVHTADKIVRTAKIVLSSPLPAMSVDKADGYEQRTAFNAFCSLKSPQLEDHSPASTYNDKMASL
jgi:hypothetical protein